MSRNLARRVAVAAIGIPLAAGVIYAGGWVLAALLVLFGVVGVLEFSRLGRSTGVRPLTAVGTVGAGLIPLAVLATMPAGGALVSPQVVLFGAVTWFIVVVGLAAWSRPPDARPLGSVALTVFAALYAGGLPAFILLLRHAPDVSREAGTALVFLPLVVTWVGDSLAMFGGTWFGGPKLAPILSPNKTWSGAVWGAVGAVVVAPLYGSLVLVRVGVDMPSWQLIVLGLVLSIVGQSGDVAESLFKREAGVKDSGTFFPGHGGVLDRFDSLYWVLPTTALLLALFGVM
jgi:phosphatidate cytidylyltransferase